VKSLSKKNIKKICLGEGQGVGKNPVKYTSGRDAKYWRGVEPRYVADVPWRGAEYPPLFN